MSKVTNVLDIANQIGEIENLIRICNGAMIDAKKALEKDSKSEELKRIYESAEFDKERLILSHNKLSEQLSDLVDSVKNDPEFLSELESTIDVDDEYKNRLESLKNEFLNQKVQEKSEE